jgi:hypothetical protein
MIRRFRFLAATLAMLAMIAMGGSAFAGPPKDKGSKQDHQGKEQGKAKGRKNVSGVDLLGDKLKHNGVHKLQDHGKFSADVDVSNGKIAGVRVKHAERGDVPVTKYKSTKKMADRPMRKELHFASQAYAQDYVTMWIGYSYIDDYGEEIIYWFPIDMILDGDAGAIEYYDDEGY